MNGSFPKAIYHASDPPKLVHDADELDAHLDNGWRDAPHGSEGDSADSDTGEVLQSLEAQPKAKARGRAKK